MSKILVIDDDEKLSGLIKDFLEPHKYQVICFSQPFQTKINKGRVNYFGYNDARHGWFSVS